MKRQNFVYLLFLCLNILSLAQLKARNLDSLAQDFVLETRRIQIPGYPYVFNPSIVKWNKSYLMTFRVQNQKKISAKLIGLIWLDNDFNIKSKPYILKIKDYYNHNFFVHKNSDITEQDPRLIVANKALYMVYNNFKIGRVFIAKVIFDTDSISLDKPECLLYFEDSNPHRIEKNWVPFEYDGKLLLSYSIYPHKVFLPIEGSESCLTYALSRSNISWNWGELRGGTQALLVDGKYLAFFHSSKYMESCYSNGEMLHHYFMGAYTFEAHPPFKITHTSPDPIICNDFYNGESYVANTWKPLRVIFPMGFVIDGNYIWISYGKQDHECWVVKIDKNKLLKSLIPV